MKTFCPDQETFDEIMNLCEQRGIYVDFRYNPDYPYVYVNTFNNLNGTSDPSDKLPLHIFILALKKLPII